MIVEEINAHGTLAKGLKEQDKILKVKNKSKININATSFLVDSQTDKIYANDDVSIKGPSTSIFSKNAVYNQVNKSISLFKDVNINTKVW